MHCRCRPAHCAALAGSVEMLRALRSERGNLWLASHVTGNYPLHEAAVARRIGRYERIRYFACLSDLSFICATIRYDTRYYFNVRSKADISQLNLPHGTDN